MADETYGPKVYLKQGGDELVVASGGKITVESGGAIENSGTTYVVTAPDDTTIEVNGSDKLGVKAGSIGADQVTEAYAALLAIVAAIPTADQEDSATIWNDEGVLKVSSAGA